MNSTGNQTAPLTPGMICSNEAELASMVTVQFSSFLANLVAAIAIWRLPGLEENKYHLVVKTLVVSDLLIPITTLPFSIISYATCSWIGGETLCSVTAFISTTFLSWSFVIVFIMCLLRFLAVTRPFVLQKPSYIYESAEDSDSRSVMALCSPYSSCYGLRKVSFVQ